MTAEAARRQKSEEGDQFPLWVKLYQKFVTPEEVLETLGVTEPPVSIFDVANKLGATLYRVEDVEWHGRVEADRQTGKAEIFVNANTPLTRQRFTVAHELGHLILHGDNKVQFRDNNFLANDREEAQANGYGAGLLMPENLVRKYAGFLSADPWELAKEFNVSVESMQYRLNALDLL